MTTSLSTLESLVAVVALVGFPMMSASAPKTGKPLVPSASGYHLRPFLDVVFTPLNERSASLSPDGKTLLFTVRLGDGYRQSICFSHFGEDRWSTPEVVSFSGHAFDADPSFSPDGRQVFFASNRTRDGAGEKADLDIWSVSGTWQSWGTPQPLPEPVNSAASESSPVVTRSGRLYFVSSRSGSGDIYVAERVGDGFGKPALLPETINSPAAEVGVAISPDEQTLVFAALGRDDETLGPGHLYTRGDLYISHWKDNAWGAARKLPVPINSAAAEAGPSFSPDGKSLYFMSERGFATEQKVTLTARRLRSGLSRVLNGRGNIYVIDADALRSVP